MRCSARALGVAVAEPSAVTPDERPTRVPTGRGVSARMALVDECLRLDVRDLRRIGAFAPTPGGAWTITASTGAALSFTVARAGQHPEALIVSYRAADGAVATGPAAHVVELAATSPFFGGKRWWFRCPGVRGEEPCGRRCRVLYLRPGNQQPGCRLCLRLTYASRQHHRAFVWERCERPLQRNRRLMRDLTSRSRRRRFRALVAVDPEGTAAAIGVSVATVFEMRRLARGSRCG